MIISSTINIIDCGVIVISTETNKITFPRKINLGCGFDYRDGYLNVDLNDFHKPDLVADVQSMPMLPDNYFEEILANDVLEHLPRVSTENVLKEWFRILKENGIIRVRTTNIISLAEEMKCPENQNIEKQALLTQQMFGTQAYNGDFHFTGFTPLSLE